MTIAEDSIFHSGVNRYLLLGGSGASSFGSWIDFLAILTMAAYAYKVSPYQMAIVSAVSLLPGILASRGIGRLCDNGNPKVVLLVSLCLRICITAGILIFHSYFAFLVFVSLRSLAAASAPLAVNVMAVRCVGIQDRISFFSVLNILNSVAKICAPAIGAISTFVADESFALILSMGFSIISLVPFAFVQMPLPTATHNAGQSKAGGPTSVGSMVDLLWIVGTYFFFVFMVNNQLPLILQLAGFDKALLGVLIGCSGAGNILSGIWLAKRTRGHRLEGKLSELHTPAGFQAVGFLALSGILWMNVPWAPLALSVVFFLIGIASAWFVVALSVYISTHHAESIGGVSGTVQTFQNTMILVAPMVGALVLDEGGPLLLFIAAALFSILSLGIFRAIRTKAPIMLKVVP